MTYNNANRKNIRSAEKDASLADTNRIAYTRKIMSDAFGREWMYNLLLRCSVFHTPFVRGSPDVTSFNCGAQNLGLQLFGDVASHCPYEYSLMMQEASTKEQAHGRRTESDSNANPGPTEGRSGNLTEPAVFGLDADGFVVNSSSGPEDPDYGPEDGEGTTVN